MTEASGEEKHIRRASCFFTAVLGEKTTKYLKGAETERVFLDYRLTKVVIF